MPKSLFVKAFVLLLFLMPGGFTLSKEPAPLACDGVTLEVRVTRTVSLLSKGSVEAVVTGGEKPIYYIFYKASGHLLSKDVTASTVADLDAGTYYCSVVDGKGCTKKTEFKIE